MALITAWFLWPEDPGELLRRALLSRNEAEQIELLQQAVAAADGHFPPAEIELCLVLAAAGNWTEASTAMTRLNRTQCSADDLLAYATLSVQGEQWNTAEMALAAIQGTTHRLEERLSLQCRLYDVLNLHKELVDAARELTKIAPETTRWWLQLASIYAQKQNTLAEIQTYKAALNRAIPVTDIVEVRRRLLDCCIDAGDATLAREQFDLLRLANVSDPRMNVWQARLCHLEGRPAEALAAINAASDQIRNIPEAIRLRGILHLEMGQYEQAEDDLTQVMAMTPEDEIACFKLAEAWRLLGHQRGDSACVERADQYHRRYQNIHKRNLERLKLSPSGL
ncbi:MAG: tetratricopeptide repeat protein [Planctomycetaceae bacterium]